MTLDEFIKEHDDKFLEVAGSAAAINQCVDLANGYIRDVLGKPIIENTNANDFPSRALDIFDWYPYQGQLPEKGDLVVWDMGSFGHIAVATGIINNGNFQTFSQNYPLGSPSHLVDFPLENNIIGYLRPIKEQTMPEPCFIDEKFARTFTRDFVDKWFKKLYNQALSDSELNEWTNWIVNNNMRFSDFVVEQKRTEFSKHWIPVEVADEVNICQRNLKLCQEGQVRSRWWYLKKFFIG